MFLDNLPEGMIKMSVLDCKLFPVVTVLLFVDNCLVVKSQWLLTCTAVKGYTFKIFMLSVLNKYHYVLHMYAFAQLYRKNSISNDVM